MLLNDLTNKQIKEISSVIAPKLVNHPAFMFYCKNGKNREKFIEDYFNYFLHKWNKKELVFSNENHDIIISLIDVNSYHSKDKGLGAAKLKKYKNPYANVSFHQGTVAYLTEIVAPANIETKIMTVYSTLNYADEVDKLVDEVTAIANENNFMIVYETFSKKSNEIMSKKGFETAYEKQFSGTQYFETVMTYYKNDMSEPVKLIESFKPIVITDEPEENKENNKKTSE
ncbi:MAG: hypothetical protein IJ731_03020 [Eubacterium sp.]|nr:hypothetical protein [Eubacterium sp.]